MREKEHDEEQSPPCVKSEEDGYAIRQAQCGEKLKKTAAVQRIEGEKIKEGEGEIAFDHETAPTGADPSCMI